MPADKGPGAGDENEASKRPKAKPATRRRVSQRGASRPPQRSSVPGVSSAAGGTAFIAFVNKLPDSHPYKAWLLLSAPALTVVALAGWNWLVDWFEKWKTRNAAEQADRQDREKLERKIREAREAIDAALRGEHLSEQARTEFLKAREDLDRFVIEIRVARVRMHDKP